MSETFCTLDVTIGAIMDIPTHPLLLRAEANSLKK